MTKPATREQQTADGGQNEPRLVLTREELAAALQVSVRTVDRMVTAGDIPVMDLGEDLVRFYLPDVLEALRSGKRKFGRNLGQVNIQRREKAPRARTTPRDN